MGTNYYVYNEQHKQNVHHIGKYGGGGAFCFSGKVFKDVLAWRDRLGDGLEADECITSEHGVNMTPAEFWEMIGQSIMGQNMREYANRMPIMNDKLSIAMGFLSGEYWLDGPFVFMDADFH